jgi:hypothetical protein
VNGAVDATAADGDEVEVTAAKTGRRSDPGSVRIEVVEHPEGVTICAVYPDVDGRRNECRPGDGGHMSTRDNDVSVHFVVRVPRGVGFSPRTVNGDVQADGLDTLNRGVDENDRREQVQARGLQRERLVDLAEQTVVDPTAPGNAAL